MHLDVIARQQLLAYVQRNRCQLVQDELPQLTIRQCLVSQVDVDAGTADSAHGSFDFQQFLSEMQLVSAHAVGSAGPHCPRRRPAASQDEVCIDSLLSR